jgi:hypothetical protein
LGLAAVDVEVVQDQVDGRGSLVLKSQFKSNFGELESGAVRRGEGEVTAGFRFHRAENVGGATALVFVVLSCFTTRNQLAIRSSSRSTQVPL